MRKTAWGLVGIDWRRMFEPGNKPRLLGPQKRWMEARRLEQAGRPAAAADIYVELASKHPRWPDAHFGLGSAWFELKEFAKARTNIEKAIALAPGRAEFHALLAEVWNRVGEQAKSLASSERAVALEPGSVRAVVVRSMVLRFAGERDAAMSLVEPMYRGGERDINIVVEFAGLAGELGRREDAIDAVQGWLAENGSGDDQACSVASLMLGEQLDKAGRYDEAFAAFVRGNDLRGAMYDAGATDRLFESRARVWSADRLGGLARSGNASEVPVFIVGMPRSGTSLVEQIIASHPKAAGAGEMLSVLEAEQELLGRLQDEAGYSGRLDGLKSGALGRVSRRVQRAAEKASRHGSGRAERVTDKLPQNFLNVGLIEVLFPKARIVHCRREPLDVCLSCYFHDFGGRSNQGYTYSLETLGRYYRRYEALMEHWGRVSGLEILEVRYEEMVSDQEGQSRRLIEFLGLEWDEGCLDFHKTVRPVITLSSDQVRRPMYTSSMKRWERYESHLEPLRRALGGL